MSDSDNKKWTINKTGFMAIDQATGIGCQYASEAFDLIEGFQKDCAEKDLLSDKFYMLRDSVLDVCINMRIALNHGPPLLLIEELLNVLEVEMNSFMNFCNGRFERSLETKGEQFLINALSQKKAKILNDLLAEDFTMADKPFLLDRTANGGTDKEKLIEYIKCCQINHFNRIEIVDYAVNAETNTALYLYAAEGAKDDKCECMILRFNGRHNIIAQLYSEVQGKVCAQQLLDEKIEALSRKYNENTMD